MQLLDDARRIDWIRLSHSENVGPQTFRMLMRKYGSAGKALEALPQLSLRGGMKRTLRVMSVEAAETALTKARELGAQFVVAGETGYPALLQHIDDAPPLLCVQGDVTLVDRESVAIVGSRNASAAGLRLARQLAAELSEEGYLVTSGLARGIDTAAHSATPNAMTAAVIACGVDVFYPPENEGLQRQIGQHGLVCTEFLPGTAPNAKHFPRRNRIISGMSRAIIVVEAALRSGSLITARQAGEQGRDVYAVPGSPLDPRAEGTNRLIRDGANIITSTQDLIESLKNSGGSMTQGNLFETTDAEIAEDVGDNERRRILTLLSPTPVDVDDIVRESGFRPAVVMAVLLELELAGVVSRSARQQIQLAG